MTDHELERLLSLTEPGELRRLYDDAYQMKLKYIGKKVSIRGLIEISNICRKNCYYCGIRSGNRNVKRFPERKSSKPHCGHTVTVLRLSFCSRER